MLLSSLFLQPKDLCQQLWLLWWFMFSEGKVIMIDEW